ncbi:MAG: hypothetical protein V8R08_01630 [Coriobacteriales bacterium]
MAILSLDSRENMSQESRELARVANTYLTDNKGADLELTDAQIDTLISELMTTDKYAVTNNDLAGLQVAAFADLRSEVRANTIAIKEEVRAVGNLVAACHADTIDKLNTLQQGMAVIGQNVVTIGSNLEQVSSQLLQLQNDFNTYVMRDELVNNVQIAKQDLSLLNQRLESDFGHNKELRRTAVGILQANDLNVRTDTILTRAEELMISTPNYWLAPALVSLASWIDASRAVSEGKSVTASDVRKAITGIEGTLKEAYIRERAKTALFFGLISRRANNIPQANAWFNEYISFQDPRAVDHTCMVLLNLYAGGLMGHGIEERMILATMNDWLEELMADADGAYAKNLVDDWKNTCKLLVTESPTSFDSYRALKAFSPSWDMLVAEMQMSSIHHSLRGFLENALSDKDFPEDDMTLIDSMIADLVNDYDAEELPIRREQEYQQLIVDLGGRRSLADTLRSIKDDILTETKSFVSIISDAGRDAGLSHATAATHALAIRIQMPWIRRAYVDITERYRSELPETIELEVGGFTAQSNYGQDEERVVKDYVAFVNKEERDKLEKSKTGMVQKVCLIAGVAAFVLGVILGFATGAPGFFLALIGAAAGGYGLFAASKARKEQQKIKEAMARKRRYGVMVIRSFMEEARQWRGIFSERDAMFNEVLADIDTKTVSITDGVVIENTTQI